MCKKGLILQAVQVLCLRCVYKEMLKVLLHGVKYKGEEEESGMCC